MSALDDFKKLMKQANEGNFEIEPEPIVEEISAIEQLKALLIEAAPKYVPKEVIEESVEAEIKQLPEKDIVQMTADLLSKSNSSNNIPAAPQDIEAQRWNDPLRNTNFVTQEQMNDHYKLLIQRIQTQLSTVGGGGEVNFRKLDDVNRSTLIPNNDNFVLEYDAATKKVQFTEDLGPIKTLKINTAGPDITRVPGTLSWNAAEDCLNIDHADGTTLQTGLETHVLIHNDSGVPLLDGEVVTFGGVDEDAPTLGVPLGTLMTADDNQPPIFMIGVVTSNIADGSTGRATTIGNVREVNTTGSNVSETWEIGDILWVHPTLAGKMTKFKPTAPDLVISVAVVTYKHVTDGILLVRPKFSPRLSYGTFLNTGDHSAPTINSPNNIPIDTIVKTRGWNLTGIADSRITCEISGLYDVSASYEVVASNSSTKNVYFWIRKNGVDEPYSTRRQTIAGNAVFEMVTAFWSVSLTAGDYIQPMWATDNTNTILAGADANAFAPAGPSVTISITESAL